MNGAILRENNFQDDIRKIEFYSEEEKKTMNEIMSLFGSTGEIYKSDQSNKISNVCANLDMNFQTINKNREEYSRILRNVITRYTETLDVVEKIMENE